VQQKCKEFGHCGLRTTPFLVHFSPPKGATLLHNRKTMDWAGEQHQRTTMYLSGPSSRSVICTAETQTMTKRELWSGHYY
jgi:hypothetical protein